MQEKINSSGANGAWARDNTRATFEDKKLAPRKFRKKQQSYLQDEVATLRDRVLALEDELEEAYDVIYRLEHGLPVSWDCNTCTYETGLLIYRGHQLHDLIRSGGL